MRFSLALLIALGLFAMAPAHATTETAPPEPAAEAPATDTADADTPVRRMELSRELHKIRPVKPQIDRAIDKISQEVPSEHRAPFTATLKRMMNYGALQYFSIKIMAELFTVQELQAMVDYYSKPEAISAADKMMQYQDKLGPEIIKMLDAAMMEMRTGRSGK